MLEQFEDKIVNGVLSTRMIQSRPNFPLSVAVNTSYDFKTNKCPFLRDDYKCNIYNDRPKICRVMGEIDKLKCEYRK